LLYLTTCYRPDITETESFKTPPYVVLFIFSFYILISLLGLDNGQSYEAFISTNLSSEIRQRSTLEFRAISTDASAAVSTSTVNADASAVVFTTATLAAPLQSEILKSLPIELSDSGNEVVIYPLTKMLFGIFPHYLCG